MGPLLQLLVLPKAGAILLLFSEITKINTNNPLLSDYTYFSPQTRVEQTPQVNFSPVQSSHRDL